MDGAGPLDFIHHLCVRDHESEAETSTGDETIRVAVGAGRNGRSVRKRAARESGDAEPAFIDVYRTVNLRG